MIDRPAAGEKNPTKMIASQNDRSRRVVFVPVKWSRVKWSVAHWEKSPQKWSTPKLFPVKWSWRQLKPVSLNTTSFMTWTSRPTSCCLQNVTAEGRRYSLIKKRRGDSLIQGCRWESFQKHVWVSRLTHYFQTNSTPGGAKPLFHTSIYSSVYFGSRLVFSHSDMLQ